MVKLVLRAEGLAVLLFSLYFYNLLKGDWLIFLLLLFLPDICMVFYLKDKKLGAGAYNLMHNFVLVVILIAAGIFLKNDLFVFLGLILAAHVGIDRFLGFGLKYPDDFKNTHLNKV